MKTLILEFRLITAILILSLTQISCSNDDREPETTFQDLLTSGKWYYQSSGDTYPYCMRQTYFEFFSNGTYHRQQTYTLAGDCLQMPVETANYTLIGENAYYLQEDSAHPWVVTNITTEVMVTEFMGTEITFDKTPD
ncbi:hypothetical protein GV828_03965 [Flavobacterium sp. NST-5]|uniref:Lipocalin-like domain-containing protein n=1 Tax=Flavobacterium ichthyis TaxID=2698827 RepID=A0ABW9Z716_9FLAO|nr:hypothetical protein [Flavobacterium ichthyis]NBL64357.1 hypothetical protein [Flavobacterium ichthyis]